MVTFGEGNFDDDSALLMCWSLSIRYCVSEVGRRSGVEGAVGDREEGPCTACEEAIA